MLIQSELSVVLSGISTRIFAHHFCLNILRLGIKRPHGKRDFRCFRAVFLESLFILCFLQRLIYNVAYKLVSHAGI